jgi:Flp pilus assembly pilin Flp
MKRKVFEVLAEFWSGNEGTDLIEFSLLLAFICLAGAAAFIGISSGTNVIWTAASNRLAPPVSGS